MSTLPPPPALPPSGIYDHIAGVTFHLAGDGTLTLCLPEPGYEALVVELAPDALAALLAFADRVDLRRLVGQLGVALAAHE